jgi:hypothetical protein
MSGSEYTGVAGMKPKKPLGIFTVFAITIIVGLVGCKEKAVTSPPPPNPCRVTGLGKQTFFAIDTLPNGYQKFQCTWDIYYESGKKKTYTATVDTACSNSKYDRLEQGDIDPDCI